ncbi:MAG: hypothetical protein Q4F24_07915, partial [Eubacteriales bacterium]|nr:hypothetical protein [Eubacteriales bacterium]
RGGKDYSEICSHYYIEEDRKKIESGEFRNLDFVICKESDIAKLTNSMAGFGMEQSQRVIIEYDKGYGYFIVKRIPMEYGISEDIP